MAIIEKKKHMVGLCHNLIISASNGQLTTSQNIFIYYLNIITIEIWNHFCHVPFTDFLKRK